MINPASTDAGLVAKISSGSQDWGDAGQVAGVGFGVVFLVLIILAVAIWVTGIAVTKLEIREKNKEAKKAEEKKVL
ncbi:OadG family protein [Chloroflexota bacterium]